MDLTLVNLIDKMDRILGVLFKYEIHAFLLLLTGAAMYAWND